MDDKVNEPVGETADEPLHNHQEETIAEFGELSTDNLGWLTKFGLLAVIVAVCIAYIRANTPRRTGPAGRHGAYEKGGSP